MENENAYRVPAVEKTILILEYIINTNEGCYLRDIHNDLNIAKTTVYSILATLVQSGIIKKTSEGLFVPTLKLTAMGLKAREVTENAHLLRPQLEGLRDRTGFTVFFCIYDNGEQIVLEKFDGFSSVVFKAYVGQRKKINTSGSGKAMAAFLNPQELQMVFDKGLDKLTANSIHEKDKFLAHLEQIRRQGYAVDDNEGELGVRCIGAPVFMYGDRVYGAVSISALSDSLPVSEIPKYAALLKEVVANISESSGFTAGENPVWQGEASHR